MDRQILEYVEEEENNQLKNFYVTNLSSLQNFKIGNINQRELLEIAEMVYNTSLCKEIDWKVLASDLGIRNNKIISHIAAAADMRQVLPMYIVLTEELGSKSYAHLICSLLELEKYNILKVLEGYTRELLENYWASEAKLVADVNHDHRSLKFSAEQTNTVSSSGELSYELTMGCLNERSTTQFNTHLPRVFETEKLIQKNNSLEINEPFFGGSSSHRLDIFPSAPRLSVFIQHTESDTDTAKELSKMLREAGFSVIAMFEMNKAVNQTEALSTIFQTVNFVVPIVSDKLLEQIKGNTQFPESSGDAKDNKTLYDCIMNEYKKSNCLNLRTRPVIMPQMDRRHLMDDGSWTILTFSFRLWKEVPKLITVLRKTIELIPPCD